MWQREDAPGSDVPRDILVPDKAHVHDLPKSAEGERERGKEGGGQRESASAGGVHAYVHKEHSAHAYMYKEHSAQTLPAMCGVFSAATHLAAHTRPHLVRQSRRTPCGGNVVHIGPLSSPPTQRHKRKGKEEEETNLKPLQGHNVCTSSLTFHLAEGRFS